jgi:lipopolysaccharide biosynthesis glycosyltransferase
MKRKILGYASDHNYFEYIKASFASFCQYNSLSEWRVVFGDIGLHSWQRAELARFGEVVQYESSPFKQQHGIVYPATHAKLKMLMDFALNDDVLLLLDADTLIFENLDKLVSEFVDSAKSVAILVEDIPEYERSPASYGWRGHRIPAIFKNREKWRNAPMANAGVLLAQGAGARDLGECGINIYEKYRSRIFVAEQTVIVSLMYDKQMPFMRLAPRYNCLAWENYIMHLGIGPHYVETQPFFRGEKIAVRHFAWCKDPLNAALPMLGSNARLLKYLKT